MSTTDKPTDAFPKGTGQPAIRALNGAGYIKFEQLAGASESELLKLHGVGPKSIRVINEALAAKGLEPIKSDEQRAPANA
jgi:predicted flap endonuclease-1-like 5' DNA nuclease